MGECVRYGFVIPTGDVLAVAELAAEAEAAGWDGVFTYDVIHIEGMGSIFDPWVVLAAMAMRTERVRIDAILTPPARRRPWKLARETVSVDHLSNGRLVLPVGLGALDDGGFGKVGEPTDRRTRAELLDEGLEILTGIWGGRPFSFQGKHYRVEEMTFLPPPLQQPRIPIWVVGAWPSERSMRRALRYDGLLAYKLGGEVTPDDIRAMKAHVVEQRGEETPFEIVWEGRTPGDDPEAASSIVRPFAEAGITWWIESMWTAPNSPEAVRTRIQQGPPHID